MTIAELLKATGRTNAELAVILDVDALTVYRWRHGDRLPHRLIRKVLCKLGHVAMSDVTWELSR